MSNKVSFSILAVTALVLSRGMFAFIDDPEGPNLLVVFVGALIISLPSLAWHVWGKVEQNNFKRITLLVILQGLTAVVLYFCLR